MVPVIISVVGRTSGRRSPRLNVVAIVDPARLRSRSGVLAMRGAGNPVPLIVMAVVGLVADAVAADRAAVGTRRRAAARPVRRAARARACSGSCRSSTACRRGSISARSPPASPPSRR